MLLIPVISLLVGSYNNRDFKEKSEIIEDKKTDKGMQAYRRAKSYFDEHEITKAIEYFEKALKYGIDEKYESIAYFDLGLLYQTLKQYDKSVDNFNKSIAIDSSNDMIWFSMANSLNLAGRSEEAKKACLKAIQINPDESLSYYILGNVYLFLGDIENSIENYKKSIKLDPSFSGAYESLYTIYRAAGRENDAEELYNEAISKRLMNIKNVKERLDADE